MMRLLVLLVVLASPASGQPRTVALGGAVTETVFALGAGGALVGRDLSSLYPPEAATLPSVGYVRALGAEGVLSLRPGLVLATSDAGPPAALRQMLAAQVPIVALDEAHSPEAAALRVRQVGAAVNRSAAADRMADALLEDTAAIRAAIARLPDRPRVLFLLSAGRGAPMAAGSGTAADAIIGLAGGVNAMAGFTGYKPVTAEAALLGAPALILTTTQTLDAAGGARAMAGLPGLAATPAGRDGRVVAFDALYLLGFGPRLPQAVRDAATAFHPGAPLPLLPLREWAK